MRVLPVYNSPDLDYKSLIFNIITIWAGRDMDLPQPRIMHQTTSLMDP